MIVFSLVYWDLLELINGGKLGNVWGIEKKIQLGFGESMFHFKAFKVSRDSINPHFKNHQKSPNFPPA
jgi:hypothetical protein